MRFSPRRDLDVQAAAAFHPTLIGASLGDAPRVHAPLSLHFGADDPVAPMTEVDAVKAALRDKPDAEFFVYPGTTHNFAVPGVPGYDPAVAALAEERVFALFDKLKSSGDSAPPGYRVSRAITSSRLAYDSTIARFARLMNPFATAPSISAISAS